jgi:hypothetical protein
MTKLPAAFTLFLMALSASPSYAQTFTVCEGSDKRDERLCGSHEAFVDSGTVDGWSANACRASGASGAFTKIKLSDNPGGGHGYTTWRVTCQ